MPAFPDVTNFLHLVYRFDQALLIGRWLRSVDEDELHAGYDALRAAARQYNCHRWLIDSRRRTDRSLNGPEWVVTQFLPRLPGELGGPLVVAFLVLPDHLRQAGAQPAAETVPDFRFARFLDEGLAQLWLEELRPLAEGRTA